MFIIALMGNDGTGKTTTAKSLVLKLQTEGYSVKYRAGFKHFILDPLLRIFFLGNAEDQQKIFVDEKKNKPAIFKIWPFFVFVDSAIGYFFLKLQKKRIIMLFDRCFYDFLMSYEYLGYSNVLIKKLFLALPKPDVCFVLDVSPEVAFNRKKLTHPNNTLDYYLSQRQRYVTLANEIGASIISTECSSDVTVNEILDQIKKHTTNFS